MIPNSIPPVRAAWVAALALLTVGALLLARASIVGAWNAPQGAAEGAAMVLVERAPEPFGLPVMAEIDVPNGTAQSEPEPGANTETAPEIGPSSAAPADVERAPAVTISAGAKNAPDTTERASIVPGDITAGR